MRTIKNIFSCFIILALGLTGQTALADYTLNMTKGVTPVSHAIYDLHMTVFWICVVIGVIVFSVMIYAIIAHRKSRGAKAATFHEHTTVEVIWAVIPLLILIAMAIPATKVLILMDDETNSEINVKITGYQWKWQYEYIDDGIKFFSNLATPMAQIKNKEPKGKHYLLEVDNPLVVPVNKKIRFFITSNDVIHSWWVPSFGVKKDAVPGFIHEAWTIIEKPGTYRGQCAELCGVNHGFMPIVVEAKSEEDYQKWIDENRVDDKQAAAASLKTWTKEELMKQGEDSYLTYCSVCHQASGEGMPPTFPGLKGSAIATGPVDKHIDVVLNGVKGTAMQAFGNQLDDSDLAAIITYERNAWGNDTGDLVQPVDIIKAKGGEVPEMPAATDAKQAEDEKVVSEDEKAIDADTTDDDDPAKTGKVKSETEMEEEAKAQAKPGPSVTVLDTYKEFDYEDLMKKGEEVYLKVCSVCHKADGTGMPPVFPALTDGKIVNGPVGAHINQVLNGVQGTAMQAFDGQLDDMELAAVITYERNAWKKDEDKGKEIVQPEHIKKARTESKGE